MCGEIDDDGPRHRDFASDLPGVDNKGIISIMKMNPQRLLDELIKAGENNECLVFHK